MYLLQKGPSYVGMGQESAVPPSLASKNVHFLCSFSPEFQKMFGNLSDVFPFLAFVDLLISVLARKRSQPLVDESTDQTRLTFFTSTILGI